jgi:hypothetical protein
MSLITKKRCANCSKKTLYFEKCKCNNEYCLNCLGFFNHNCTFDWKKDKKEYLTNKNPKIIAMKVENI